MKVKCIVNYDKGRIRVYDGADIDTFFMFNPDEKTWQEVLVENGFSPEAVTPQFIESAKNKETSKHTEDVSLLDIFSGCTRSIKEEKAEQVLYTYLDSIRDFLGDDGEADVTPDVLEDYALCRDNYPQGITFVITCTSPDKIEECQRRCEAFYADLELLYDTPPKISMTVNY